MKLRIVVILSAILMIAFAFPVSAETVEMKYFLSLAIPLVLALAPFFMAALDIFGKTEREEKQKRDTSEKRFYGVLFVAIVYTITLEMPFVASVGIIVMYCMYYAVIWVLHSTLQEGT